PDVPRPRPEHLPRACLAQAIRVGVVVEAEDLGPRMRVPEELPDEADRRVDVLLIEDVERDDRGLGAEDLAVGRVELREALLLPAGRLAGRIGLALAAVDLVPDRDLLHAGEGLLEFLHLGRVLAHRRQVTYLAGTAGG